MMGVELLQERDKTLPLARAERREESVLDRVELPL